MLESREVFFVLVFVGTWGASFCLTYLVRKLALQIGVRDLPDAPRKIHTEPRPKMGGLAIFASFIVAIVAMEFFGLLTEISVYRLVALVMGGTVLVIGGILDDRYDLKAWQQILFPTVAALLVVLSGSHISYITNPFGGDILLDQYKLGVYPIFGALLVFGWILGMTYTTKFLDGMDGLVSGVSGIAGLVIFGLSLGPQVNQTSTAFIALAFAAAVLGFLPANFHPAKIFLGEGGSTFTGFMIGSLAVISGAKIATALLVLGIPVLDVAWVIARRLWFRSSPFRGDKRHLHFQLLDIGFSQRKAVLFLYLISAVFGALAIFLQSIGKLVALGVLFVLMAGVVVFVAYRYRKLASNNSNLKI